MRFEGIRPGDVIAIIDRSAGIQVSQVFSINPQNQIVCMAGSDAMFDRDANRIASGWSYYPGPVKYKVVIPGYNECRIVVVAREGITSTTLTATWQLYELYLKLCLV